MFSKAHNLWNQLNVPTYHHRVNMSNHVVCCFATQELMVLVQIHLE